MPRKQLQNQIYSGSYNGTSTTAIANNAAANKQWRSIWFRTTNHNSSYATLTTDGGVNLRMFVNNGIAVGFTIVEFSSGVFVADGRWHHMVLYHDIGAGTGSTYKIWIDGILKLSSNSVGRNNTAYQTTIGFDGGGTRWIGDIGIVAEGSGAPTDLEVWNMYFRGLYPSHTTALWRFNEGAGTVSSDGIGSNALTLTNFTWSRSVPPQMTDRLSIRNQPALQSIASAETVTSANNTGITGSASFTMGGWCKFGSLTGTFEMLMNFGASASAQSWYLGCNDTGYLTAGLFSNNGISSVPVPVGKWIHLACSWDGTTLRIYMNAKLIYSSTSGSGGAYSPSVAAGKFVMLRSISGTTYQFVGHAGEAFLANAALSQSAIQQIYARSIYPSSATIIYRFQERGGTTISDSSGNANNGTLSAESVWGALPVSTPRLAPRTMRSSLTGFTAAANSRLDLGNAASVQITTGTALVWFRSSSLRGSASAIYNTILAKDTNYAFYEYLGELIAYDWNATANRRSGFYTPNNGWHLAAYVFESGVASGSWATLDAGPIKARFIYTLTGNAANLCLGNQASGSNAIRGNIGEAILCNTKLTQAEIADYYYRGKLPASAFTRIRLNEGTGTTAADSIGSNNGTLSGTISPVWSSDVAISSRL